MNINIGRTTIAIETPDLDFLRPWHGSLFGWRHVHHRTGHSFCLRVGSVGVHLLWYRWRDR